MKEINKCPHCNSIKFIKYGRYRNLQRFQCKECSKTFNEGTGLIWSNSRKSTNLWLKYLKLMFAGATIRSCASNLNICIETSFKWRHKILKHLSHSSRKKGQFNKIAIKHTTFKESFKGQKVPPVSTLKSPRRVVFVATTMNKTNYSLAKVSFIGLPPCKEDYQKITSKLNPSRDSIFIPAQDRFSLILARKLNNALNVDPTISIDKNEEFKLLSSCTDFLIEIRRWISAFRSVATKYLDSYLDWFVYLFENSTINHTILSNIINSIFSVRLV